MEQNKFLADLNLSNSDMELLTEKITSRYPGSNEQYSVIVVNPTHTTIQETENIESKYNRHLAIGVEGNLESSFNVTWLSHICSLLGYAPSADSIIHVNEAVKGFRGIMALLALHKHLSTTTPSTRGMFSIDSEYRRWHRRIGALHVEDYIKQMIDRGTFENFNAFMSLFNSHISLKGILTGHLDRLNNFTVLLNEYLYHRDRVDVIFENVNNLLGVRSTWLTYSLILEYGLDKLNSLTAKQLVELSLHKKRITVETIEIFQYIVENRALVGLIRSGISNNIDMPGLLHSLVDALELVKKQYPKRSVERSVKAMVDRYKYNRFDVLANFDDKAVGAFLLVCVANDIRSTFPRSEALSMARVKIKSIVRDRYALSHSEEEKFINCQSLPYFSEDMQPIVSALPRVDRFLYLCRSYCNREEINYTDVRNMANIIFPRISVSDALDIIVSFTQTVENGHIALSDKRFVSKLLDINEIREKLSLKRRDLREYIVDRDRSTTTQTAYLDSFLTTKCNEYAILPCFFVSKSYQLPIVDMIRQLLSKNEISSITELSEKELLYVQNMIGFKMHMNHYQEQKDMYRLLDTLKFACEIGEVTGKSMGLSECRAIRRLMKVLYGSKYNTQVNANFASRYEREKLPLTMYHLSQRLHEKGFAIDYSSERSVGESIYSIIKAVHYAKNLNVFTKMMPMRSCSRIAKAQLTHGNGMGI